MREINREEEKDENEFKIILQTNIYVTELLSSFLDTHLYLHINIHGRIHYPRQVYIISYGKNIRQERKVSYKSIHGKRRILSLEGREILGAKLLGKS